MIFKAFILVEDTVCGVQEKDDARPEMRMNSECQGGTYRE
jgi:hypothetical protein